MERSDFSFVPLDQIDWQRMVTAGTLQGISPLFNNAASNWRAMIAECKKADVDPRVLMAALLFEDHFGTDPNGGVELSKVYNFSGITFASQPGAFRSDILRPLNERPDDPEGKRDSSHYAGFYDFGGFVAELIRTLNNQYCGPAFRSGDLATAWAIYVGGPNNPNMEAGQSRVDQWQYYLRHYPLKGDDPVTDAVYGEDLIAYARTLVGQAFSTLETDPINGVHPWAYWCESFAERVPEHLGLEITHRGSATAKGMAYRSEGSLHTIGEPEHGAHVIFGPAFYGVDGDGDGLGDGHIGFWDKERGMLLGTVTDGTGIGYRSWGMQTAGVMGWARVSGIRGEYHVGNPGSLPPAPVFIQPSNPYGAIALHEKFWARFDFLERTQIGLGYAQMGFARSAYLTLPDGRIAQRFQRGWFAITLNPDPFDVVGLFPEEYPK